MKVTSTISAPYFFYPGTSPHRRSVRWQTATRRANPAPSPETDDELTRKQEFVCGAILALSSVSTVLLCLWQLAVS